MLTLPLLCFNFHCKISTKSRISQSILKSVSSSIYSHCFVVFMLANIRTVFLKKMGFAPFATFCRSVWSVMILCGQMHIWGQQCSLWSGVIIICQYVINCVKKGSSHLKSKYYQAFSNVFDLFLSHPFTDVHVWIFGRSYSDTS